MRRARAADPAGRRAGRGEGRPTLPVRLQRASGGAIAITGPRARDPWPARSRWNGWRVTSVDFSQRVARACPTSKSCTRSAPPRPPGRRTPAARPLLLPAAGGARALFDERRADPPRRAGRRAGPRYGIEARFTIASAGSTVDPGPPRRRRRTWCAGRTYFGNPRTPAGAPLAAGPRGGRRPRARPVRLIAPTRPLAGNLRATSTRWRPPPSRPRPSTCATAASSRGWAQRRPAPTRSTCGRRDARPTASAGPTSTTTGCS